MKTPYNEIVNVGSIGPQRNRISRGYDQSTCGF